MTRVRAVLSDGGVPPTTSDVPVGAAAPPQTPRTAGWRALLVLAATAGLLAGALTSFGQTLLGSTAFQGLANGVSPWLVTPFVVGAVARRPSAAALAGLLTCAGQVAGYYLVADLRGFAVGAASMLLWTCAGVLGGPVFGAAGWLWRTARSVNGRWSGVGGALLAGCWLAEALITYLVVLRRPDEALVFAVVAALLAGLLSRRGDRRALLTRLPVAAAVGAAGFAALHVVIG